MIASCYVCHGEFDTIQQVEELGYSTIGAVCTGCLQEAPPLPVPCLSAPSCDALVDPATAPRAQVGDQAGHFCPDCAFWCDGNLIPEEG